MQPTLERTRAFTWSDPLEAARGLAGRSGLEAMQAVASGEVPPPPIAELLGMSIAEVAEGRAVFACDPAEWMYNPIGSVHGGIAATLLDSCMGCAVHTTLEPGWA
jgi:acyl-coenzyme A thioesterase PaaI-like protein